LAGDRREGVQEVARRSRQAIKARDDEHVADVELGEHAAELGAVSLRAARHLARAGGLELAHLGIDALTVGRDSCIAVFHGVILHRNSAPEKPKVINGLSQFHALSVEPSEVHCPETAWSDAP
jgi:hypothetical protein